MAAPGGHASKSPAYTNTANEIEARRQRIFWSLQGASASVMGAAVLLTGVSASVMEGYMIAAPSAHAPMPPAWTKTAHETEGTYIIKLFTPDI